MNDESTDTRVNRRSILRGSVGGAAILALPACASLPGFNLTEAIQRLLLLSSENAFARMLAPDGFWDQQVAGLGLNNLLGTSGGGVASLLTSTLFKNRLEGVFADIAIDGSRVAAPIVADAVRSMSIADAAALVRGGPSAASELLRGQLGGRLVEQMVPELGDAIRIASDPLVAQLINSAAGADIGGIAQRFAGNVDNAIWTEIGTEEAAIRADPQSTGDPLLIGVFGAGSLF